MKLGLDLNVKQKQTLVISNQLIQGINILQYNVLELSDYLNQELEKNPLLEKDESSNELKDNEIDWAEFMKNQSATKVVDPVEYDPEQEERKTQIPCVEESLKDVLVTQLHVLDLTIQERLVGEVIIDFIDEKGYLTATTKEIAEVLNIAENEVERILARIQRFEPSGVGGEDVRQCLSIQLRNLEVKDEELYDLIENHLEELAYHKDRKIQKATGLDQELIEEYRDIIQSLDPKPGLKYCGRDVEYVLPEVFVEYKDGKVKIELNEGYVPSLKINEYYVKLLQTDLDEKTKEFIKSRLNAASFIVNSILQRRDTIRKICEMIFTRQTDFLLHGDSALKPLTLKEVADQVDVHESTVSRAVKNKYAVTPQGIYPLKHFFATALHSAGGEDVSAIKVREKIREMIDTEDKKKPLSDQKITDVLKEQGYEISRRTVAKYRDQLQIPSTRERKRG
ncbi:MAG TPA: RNA polymerase sigma-54 factor [Eubacteriaceae bacterium]|nr:RNA polymerase sigma-54 factor [Eubacteriaceae bacterium]